MGEIEFEIHGVKLKIVDDEFLYYYVEKWGDLKVKKPYWKLKKMTPEQKGYLRFRINYKNFRFHRVVYYSHNLNWNIYDSSPDNQIDHIDNNKLNNNISNLRVVNNSENQLNTDKVRNAKGFRYHKKSNKYHTRISINKKVISLGLFDTKDEAHNVYLNKRYELHGF